MIEEKNFNHPEIGNQHDSHEVTHKSDTQPLGRAGT